MTEATLPKTVIDKDHKLDAAIEKSQQQLAELRWHWTLDESNPNRVSMNQYAKDVGLKSHKSVSVMANGYAAWLTQTGDGATPTVADLASNIEVAKIGATKQEAAKAIAAATGRSPGNVARHSRSEIKAVVGAAEDAAERKGTTVEEEIPRIAASHAKTRAHEAKTKADKKAQHTLRYVEIEGHLASAKRHLNDALNTSHDVAFDDGEEDLLRDSISNLTALLGLIDLRLGGSADIDWDTEALKLGDPV